MMKRKWAINSAFMVFYGFAATVRAAISIRLRLISLVVQLVIWVLYAYKMAFGNQWIPLAGVPGQALDIDYLLSQSNLPAANVVQNYPMATMVYFQVRRAASPACGAAR
jgi:Amt family ammonium transporter